MRQQTEPHIVVIGGGTGISTMLRGLKRYTSHLTAIVTVADNGGGSGILREEMKMLHQEIFEIVSWLWPIQNQLWKNYFNIDLQKVL